MMQSSDLKRKRNSSTRVRGCLLGIKDIAQLFLFHRAACAGLPGGRRGGISSKYAELRKVQVV
jgi:hypothetical protein